MALSTDNLVRGNRGVYADDTSRLTDLDLLAAALNDVLWSGIKTQTSKNQQMVNLATVAVAQGQDGFILAFNDHNLDNRTQSSLPNIGNLATTSPAELAVVGRVADEVDAPADAGAGAVLSSQTRRASIVTQILVRDGGTKKLVTRTIVPKFTNGEVIFSPRRELRVTLEKIVVDDMLVLSGMSSRNITILLPSTISTEHAEMRLLGHFQSQGKKPAALGVSKPCCHLCAEALDEAGVGFTRWSIVRNMAGWLTPGEITAKGETRAERI